MGGETSKDPGFKPEFGQAETGDPQYEALSKDQLTGFRETELTDDQIKKQNERAKGQIDKQLKKWCRHLRKKNNQNDELRLVLLGKTGAGKSATGNLLLGRRCYLESNRTVSCTQKTKEEEVKLDGIRVRIIDTPGLQDTTKSNLEVTSEIAKVLDTFNDGIHGFLFVFNLGNPRFTAEEKSAFEDIEKTFRSGGSFFEHCFVILTHASNETSLEDMIRIEKDDPFGKLIIQDLGEKVIAVNNKSDTKYMVRNLRQQIVRLIDDRVQGAYTNDAIKEFVSHRAEVVSRLGEAVKKHAITIEHELSNMLNDLSYEEIRKMSKKDQSNMVDDAYSKLENIGDIPEPDMKTGIRVILDAKIYRLTDKGFLGNIIDFVTRLLATLGFKK